ncbi:MAG TPA: ATP-binding protein [Pseudogracilibacillus sp.]|nr:ATP-binding protein [Pseudogracilibacillus sp.]
MKRLFSKKVISYALFFFLVIALTGIILLPVTNNYFMLFSVLIIEFIIFLIFIVQFFDKYIHPIENTSQTMDKLLEGNFHARVHQPMNGTIGELSQKINALARNLSKLTIQEQIQAEQLSTVIENSESGLVLIDEKGYVHIVNRKFLAMIDKPSQDFIGDLYYDVFQNEDFQAVVQEAFLYEERVKKEFSFYQHGETVYLEMVGAPIFNERNFLRGAVLVISDITEFKHVEMMRKDFVANVSHELKTPITSIKGFAETLLDGALQDKATQEQFLNIIYEESDRIQLLIEDLLSLSRLEKEDSGLQIDKVHLDDLIENVLKMIAALASEKETTIQTEVQPHIVFQADEEKIKQLLLNLLTNAISYTPAHAKVRLNVHQKNGAVSIQVSDEGIGIEQQDLPRIFERFYRVDAARSRDTGGTGLGLAIVKHIVELHQGQIEVDSEYGKGTSFTVSLPAVDHTQWEQKEKELNHDE